MLEDYLERRWEVSEGKGLKISRSKTEFSEIWLEMGLGVRRSVNRVDECLGSVVRVNGGNSSRFVK